MKKFIKILSNISGYSVEELTERNTDPIIQPFDCLEAMKEAINYTHCCKSDSELLRGKKEPTTWDAFLAGYKKRAEMSGLKYDEVSELHAKTLYKCWNSFDLNP
tara:strand:- start:231 stop:542 length:312 start_codon:yes stop_codon:yes gene_type:complete